MPTSTKKKYTLAEEDRVIKLRVQRYTEEMKQIAETGAPPVEVVSIRQDPARAGYGVDATFPREVWKLRWKPTWVHQLAVIAALGGRVHLHHATYGLLNFFYAQAVSDGEIETYVFDAWTRNRGPTDNLPCEPPPPVAFGRHIKIAGVTSLKKPIIEVLKSPALDEVGGIQLSRTAFYQINELARTATAAAVAFQLRGNGLMLVQMVTQTAQERNAYVVDALHFPQLSTRPAEPSLLAKWQP